MSKPFVCTGCRVRLTLRPRTIAAYEHGSQRRDFSRPASNSQTDYAQLREQREQLRRRRVYEDGLSQVGLGRSQPATGGRYSGEPLRPQQLLQELGETTRPAQSRPPRDHKPIRRQPGVDELPSNIEEFEDHVANSELSEAWKALRRYRAETNNRSRIYFPTTAVKKLHRLMRRIVVDYVKELGKSSSGLPTPWQFVQVAKALKVLSPELLSELLWRLENGIAIRLRADGDMNESDQTLAFEQVTLVWHDALQTKLSTSGPSRQEPRSNVSSLSWSFLPLAYSVAKGSKGVPKRLQDVIADITPIDGPNRLATIVELQSTLLLAVDLLKNNAGASSVPTSTVAGNLYWGPLVEFFDGILGRVVKPSVPPTILTRLEQSQDPSLAYYEEMVRRLDLANIPPIRTDRSKALGDRRPAKIDVLGNPLAKRSAAQSPKPDTQADKLEGPEKVNDSTPTSKSLDKASLREAGFSISEDSDMDSAIYHRAIGWVKRLDRAMDNSNLLMTETCWKEVCKFNAKDGASPLPLFLYEHFMLAFLALRQPALALEAWNAVEQSGIRPTVKTWTVMMRGCSRANDADTLELFWARMREQDMQPDQHAWSIRLFCLIKAGRLQKASAGLRRMGHEWVAAVRAEQKASLPAHTGKQHAATNLPPLDVTRWNSDVGGVPRPNLAIVNTVVSALAKKADEHIPQVLAWARDFGIDLDLATYNVLLNVAMRHGRMAQAMSILKHMKSQAIQPNSTTITVILTALFHSEYFGELPAEEKPAKLFEIIAAIEASAPEAKLDAKGYALAIDRMLKEHEDPEAAQALIEHMSARGLEPTVHIYTILMTSYFDASPPNFAAAEALWARLQNSNNRYGAALDTIFYDRMVEAYARHHDHVGIAPMMDFLERMSREGKRPGWQVLELVAKALSDRAEWGRLQGLVDDIRNSKGLLRVGVRGLVGQNEFWRFVISTGILDREGVTNEQDLRINVSKSSFHGL